MKKQALHSALDTATAAAKAAGELMRKNFRLTKKITNADQHDIKLELDVRCQKLIQRRLRERFPAVPVLGEEGILGDPEASRRWVVDPIDGTVNFTYGIPHACVSIALQQRRSATVETGRGSDAYETVVGVVFDPFCDELWTAIRGGPARLNQRVIRVSQRRRLGEAIVSIGFAKQVQTLEQMLPVLNQIIRRVRKIRLMGAAALAMTYVASGRFDAYVESGIRLWDIAAGGLILECAGGEFWRVPTSGDYTYFVMANNGHMRRNLKSYVDLAIPEYRAARSQ